MAKVEMSLQEYETLMENHRMLQEIVDAITNPEVESWDVNYYKGNPEASISVRSCNLNNMSLKSREFLTSIIIRKSEEFIKSSDFDGEFTFDNNLRCIVGYINHLKEDPEE